ncbi:MAG TPA: FHA domain-containing protein [Thermoanaerobaculia bacterium]|nr:FHA domain-containing protein [Thermoanaerobaculia bacterium]
MIIECTSCHARYQYNEDRFERKPSKKIKCAKCGTVFEIHNPAFAEKPPTVERSYAGDMTFARREEPKSEPHEPAPPKRDTNKVALPQMPSGKRLSLAVISGPDAGSVFRIEKPKVTIGRTGADVVLNDSEISRAHAAVEIRDATYLLEDLKSTNGTLVDGEKITAPRELQNHSEFQVGGSTLMLIVTEDV